MKIISPDFRGELQAAIEAAREAAFPFLQAASDPMPPKDKVCGIILMAIRYPSGFT